MVQDDRGPTWRYLAIGAITALISLAGYIIGDFVSDIRDRLAVFQQALDSRASLAPRLDALERADADKETRLRAIEQDHWRSGRQR